MLYVGDFVSGAMLVGRGRPGQEGRDQGAHRRRRRAASGCEHVLGACAAEIGENEELPNTTNPDDWARVSGRKGERIVFLRTLVGSRALAT